MTAELQTQEWYNHLVEQLQATLTEAIFNSRWALVEGYWISGKLIREAWKEHYIDENPVNVTQLLQDLAVSISKSYRTLWYALATFDTYPSIDKLPEGKNISWNKLITKYLPALKKENIPLPQGNKYSVIYADPPWDIGSMVLEKWESSLDDKYPTMSLGELQRLDIQSLTNNDCVCFMWSTLSTLPQALIVLGSWGFKYHITLTWDKGNGWSANGFHRKSELILVGYKGILSNVIRQEGEYIPTVFFEKKTTHSTKPEIMYKYIENRTIGKKIELFARNKMFLPSKSNQVKRLDCQERKGWDVWGNQV